MASEIDTSAPMIEALVKQTARHKWETVSATLSALAAERDAAQAALREREKEVGRLREALRSIAETCWDMAAPEACLVMATTLANAALAAPAPAAAA